MNRKWRLGERVVLLAGGAMVGTIMKVGRRRSAGVTVRWPNGTLSTEPSDAIRIPLPGRLERFRDIFEK